MAKEIKTEEDVNEIMSAINRYKHQTTRFYKATEQIEAAVNELNELRTANERDIRIMKAYEIYSMEDLIKAIIKPND